MPRFPSRFADASDRAWKFSPTRTALKIRRLANAHRWSIFQLWIARAALRRVRIALGCTIRKIAALGCARLLQTVPSRRTWLPLPILVSRDTSRTGASFPS